MGQLSCPDCGNPVPDVAPACPKCGGSVASAGNVEERGTKAPPPGGVASKALAYLCLALGLSGFLGNALLLIYVEWGYISRNFLQILNPLLQVQVIFDLVQLPLFWILLGITIVGLFGMTRASGGRWRDLIKT